MHPLPRVDELAYDMDADPRSMYFKQAARGVPVRMALIALALGAKKSSAANEVPIPAVEYPMYRREYGVKCSNPRCVTWQETEKNYLKPEFKVVSFQTPHLPLYLLRARHRTEICRQHRMASRLVRL